MINIFIKYIEVIKTFNRTIALKLRLQIPNCPLRFTGKNYSSNDRAIRQQYPATRNLISLFPLDSSPQTKISSRPTIYNLVQRLSGSQSMPLNQRLVLVFGVYIVVIFRANLPPCPVTSVGNLALSPPLEDGIYAEVNRLLPRKSEVIEC